MKILIKRVYEEPGPNDGSRVLVDRLWPRGLAKEKAKVDLWLKSIAPSNELRKWYQHDVEKWAEFKQRYFSELKQNPEAVNELMGYIQRIQGDKVTFLYSSKEQRYNNAAALKEYVNCL